MQDDAGTQEMFRRERRSRERYFEATACCDSMPAPMAQKMKRKMAQDDKFFNDDDL